MNIAQMAVAGLERLGERPTISFQDSWYTNQQIMDRACRLAAVLQERGVGPGDRVIVMMETNIELACAFQAIPRLGAILIPIMPQWVPHEVRYVIENSGAEVVITSPLVAPCVVKAREGIDQFRHVLVCGPTELPGCEDILPAIDSAVPCNAIYDCDADDVAVLVYTSGTTGNPKGVMLTHGNMYRNTQAVADMFDVSPDYRALMVLPLNHVYGIMLLNLQHLSGGVYRLMQRFDAGEVLQTIQDFKVERCALVPAMLVALLHHPNREKYDVSTLKVVSAGSAPLSPTLQKNFSDAFGCRVKDGYGQSEATCAVTAYLDDETYVPGSVGRAIPGIDMCIQNEDNEIVPAGETGEICIRGNNVMLGYWNNEQATKSAIVDGWLHSGDIGHIDEDGYIFITDRKKDMIIKGGENISPRQIEEAIAGLPGVIELAVYSVPDEKFQEEIAVSVVVGGGVEYTDDQIREQVLKSLTKFKVPKYIEFRDALPKNSNGKILKRTLRRGVSNNCPVTRSVMLGKTIGTIVR